MYLQFLALERTTKETQTTDRAVRDATCFPSNAAPYEPDNTVYQFNSNRIDFIIDWQPRENIEEQHSMPHPNEPVCAAVSNDNPRAIKDALPVPTTQELNPDTFRYIRKPIKMPNAPHISNPPHSNPPQKYIYSETYSWKAHIRNETLIRFIIYIE